jgi:hypothetical protein
MGLFLKAFFVSKTMVEKPILPDNPGLFRNKPFPITQSFVHAFIGREGHQSVQVIGHRKEKMRPELSSANVMVQGIGHGDKNIIPGQSVYFASGTANCDEENFSRFDPRRRSVEEVLALWQRLHGR